MILNETVLDILKEVREALLRGKVMKLSEKLLDIENTPPIGCLLHSILYFMQIVMLVGFNVNCFCKNDAVL